MSKKKVNESLQKEESLLKEKSLQKESPNKKSIKYQKEAVDIIFLVPGRETSMTWVVAWSDLIVKCLQANLKIKFITQYNAVVYYARNACLMGNNTAQADQELFGGQFNYKYICWIDSDTLPSFEGLARLINQDKDIIGGIYKMQNNKDFAVVKEIDYDYFKKNGHFEFLSVNEVKALCTINRKSKDIKDTLMEVEYSGFGFMLIKKGVFEAIKYPWFKPLFFDIPGNDITEFMSEDVSFCQSAKKLGFKVFVDFAIQCGHVKSFII